MKTAREKSPSLLLASLALLLALWMTSSLQAQIYISNLGTTVVKYGLNGSLDTGFTMSVGGAGFYGLAVDGNDLYAANFSGQKVQKYDATSGAFSANVLSPGASPFDVAVYGSTLYSTYNSFVQLDKSTTSGTGFAVFATAGLANPVYGTTVDSAGNVYVVNYTNSKVVKYTVVGGVLTATDTNFISTNLSNPFDLTVDASGNVYVVNYAGATANAGTVTKYDSTGAYVSTLVTGLTAPHGIGLDGLGNFYVADTGHNQVGKYDTVTGAGTSNFISIASPFYITTVVSTVPEPSSIALLCIGGAAFAAWRMRRKLA
ncbi:MAG: PEP-CTERM sorting domain-containing protein [Chthoniobacterales bacterium]